MKNKDYYKIIFIICLIEIINYIVVNLSNYLSYDISISMSSALTVFLLGLSATLSVNENFWALIIFLLMNIQIYITAYNFGITGFSMPDNIAWQPLLTTWLAMFSIIFCIIGGAYLFFKRSSKR